MKGIILAGGSGTRLFPITKTISKQLLPVYDKPMIYYPLSVLMLSGIREILIITTPTDLNNFKLLLGDGKKFGISLFYAVQPYPGGIAQAFLIGKEFIGNDTCALILGDNILYGSGLTERLTRAAQNAENGYATIFGFFVDDPKQFGVMDFTEEFKVLSVEEKPENPKSNYAIIGLYFYDNKVCERVLDVVPSSRGELEITSLNELYLKSDSLKAEILGRGYAWFDTGTVDSLLEASSFVQTIENRQGVLVSSLEEIAYRKGWISEAILKEAIESFGKSKYGKHLNNVISGRLKY